MGYILPVTHYTYQQYQIRQIDKKNRPYYVDKPYRVKFKQHDFRQHNENQPFIYKKEGQVETSQRERKGQYINEKK